MFEEQLGVVASARAPSRREAGSAWADRQRTARGAQAQRVGGAARRGAQQRGRLNGGQRAAARSASAPAQAS
jgi:hypothetical protein